MWQVQIMDIQNPIWRTRATADMGMFAEEVFKAVKSCLPKSYGVRLISPKGAVLQEDTGEV